MARLQAALNTPLSTVVIATDLEGRVTFFNIGAEELLGYKATDVVGTAIPDQFMAPHELETKAAAIGSDTS